MVATVRLDFFDAFGIFQKTDMKQIHFNDLKEIEDYCQKQMNKAESKGRSISWYVMEVK